MKDYYPAAGPQHADWLDSDEPYCGAQRPNFPYYECTRQAGHEGDHAAHGSSDAMFTRWPQEGGAS